MRQLDVSHFVRVLPFRDAVPHAKKSCSTHALSKVIQKRSPGHRPFRRFSSHLQPSPDPRGTQLIHQLNGNHKELGNGQGEGASQDCLQQHRMRASPRGPHEKGRQKCGPNHHMNSPPPLSSCLPPPFGPVCLPKSAVREELHHEEKKRHESEADEQAFEHVQKYPRSSRIVHPAANNSERSSFEECIGNSWISPRRIKAREPLASVASDWACDQRSTPHKSWVAINTPPPRST